MSLSNYSKRCKQCRGSYKGQSNSQFCGPCGRKRQQVARAAQTVREQLAPRTCHGCGKKYTRLAPWSRYCSVECATQALILRADRELRRKRKLQKARRVAGLCVRCGAGARKSRTMCAACAAYAVTWQNAHNRLNRRAGIS